MDEGRRRHYGAFYGLDELPGGEARHTRRGGGTGEPPGGQSGDGHRPRVAVYGNCQAEALRVSIDTAGVVDSVRMPPVHELTEEDLPHLDRVLGWADVLVAQAVADGYRDLPLGTAQVADRMRPEARVVRAPNYFCTALYPEQVLVRHEDPGVVDPPVVPYHDVRRIGRAAGWSGPWEAPEEAVVQGTVETLAELRRREDAQGSVRISDVVRAAGAECGWTVDHPGNTVLLQLATRVLDQIGGEGFGDGVHDPGRVLLSAVFTPLRPEVLSALGLDQSHHRGGWLINGDEVSDDEVGAAHEEFYATHPKVVEVGIAKKGEVLRRLGWQP